MEYHSNIGKPRKRASAGGGGDGGGDGADSWFQTTTPKADKNGALQAISPNVRSIRTKHALSTMSVRLADEHVIGSAPLASQTPAKRTQQLQQTPNSAYMNTAKRLRTTNTPGRGWTKPTTPHGVRALEMRNAALTPGTRGRRQSGRLKRETPRDWLRALTRVMPRTEEPKIQTLEPTLEVAEELENEQSSDEAAPELSFAPDSEDSGFEVEKARRMSERYRLSLADNSMFIDGELDMDESDDGGEKPVTTLLDDSLSSGDLEPPDEPTFGDRDQPGDTQALRQLLALTQSPKSPQMEFNPLTPTGDLSFALDIPQLPQTPEPEPILNFGADQPELSPIDDGEAFGFEIAGADDFHDYPVPDADPEQEQSDQTQLGGSGLVPDIDRALTQDPHLAEKQLATKPVRKYTRRAPKRDGLSRGIIKKVATSLLPSSGLTRGRLKHGALEALIQTTDWFMEQASEDLAAFSKHAGRRTINEKDFILLAQRQRLLNKKSTVFSLATKYLPQELLRQVRGANLEAAPSKVKRTPGAKSGRLSRSKTLEEERPQKSIVKREGSRSRT